MTDVSTRDNQERLIQRQSLPGVHTRHLYRVHGLTISSEIELPGLRPLAAAGPGAAAVDIEIDIGLAPYELRCHCGAAEGYQVGDGEMLFIAPGVGRYWARRGRTLTVSPAVGADLDTLRLYLLGSGLAALLHQRGLLPLHACAFARDGACIACMGVSGAGKSTLAAMMVRRGFQLLSDDVLVIARSEDGSMLAAPSVPTVNLLPESLTVAGMADIQFQLPSMETGKHRVNAPGKFTEMWLPLRRLYLLRWLVPTSASPEVEHIPAFKALTILRRNIFRDGLIDAMGREREFLDFSAALLATVEVFEFRRPMDLARAEAQVDMLVRHLGETAPEAVSVAGPADR